MSYFHSKVKFLRQMDNGLIKQISEQYLVDAVSFTEVETRIIAEIGEGMREVSIQAIAISPIKEVVMYGDTDLFHKCRVRYSLMDEDTEKEKKITTYLLVNASDVPQAHERVAEHLKEMLVPFECDKVELSPIIEVYEYQKAAPAGFKKVVQDLKDLGVTMTVTTNMPAKDHEALADAVTERLNNLKTENKEADAALNRSFSAPFDPEGGLEHDPNPADEEEECAMEDESIATDEPKRKRRPAKPQYLKSQEDENLFPSFDTIPKRPCPTEGQAVAVHDSPPIWLAEQIASAIPNVTLGQIGDIYNYGNSLDLVDFQAYMCDKHGINRAQYVHELWDACRAVE